MKPNPSESKPQTGTDWQLKPGSSPPSPWVLRSLLAFSLTCTILGAELVFDSILRNTSLMLGSTNVPTYVPGALFLLLGTRNLWSWYSMKRALDDT